ncbi:MAG: hypothetical protein ACLRP3_08160 [Escherichia sp.]
MQHCTAGRSVLSRLVILWGFLARLWRPGYGLNNAVYFQERYNYYRLVIEKRHQLWNLLKRRLQAIP